jgi:hypothetical protein
MELVVFLGIHMVRFGGEPVWVGFYILYCGIECML